MHDGVVKVLLMSHQKQNGSVAKGMFVFRKNKVKLGAKSKKIIL